MADNRSFLINKLGPFMGAPSPVNQSKDQLPLLCDEDTEFLACLTPSILPRVSNTWTRALQTLKGNSTKNSHSHTTSLPGDHGQT